MTALVKTPSSDEVILGAVLFVVRLPLVLIWLVSSLLCVAVVYPLVGLSARSSLNHAWSRLLMAICGVRVCVVGQPPMNGEALWVANHVSWIDIFILSSVRCVAFIAKRDIRGWPVIGWLVEKAGTVFIDRTQRNSIRHVGEQMQAMFRRGQVVGLFAEGTTTTGFDVLPFHASLFEPALRAGVLIQPVALRFYHRGQRSDRVAFVGEQSLARNLSILLASSGTRVDVEFLPALTAQHYEGWSRAQLSTSVRETIRAAVLDMPPDTR
ncbi:MAG: lysophospholipid acyltransferase family protein [Pusillimonas sp.]